MTSTIFDFDMHHGWRDGSCANNSSKYTSWHVTIHIHSRNCSSFTNTVILQMVLPAVLHRLYPKAFFTITMSHNFTVHVWIISFITIRRVWPFLCWLLRASERSTALCACLYQISPKSDNKCFNTFQPSDAMRRHTFHLSLTLSLPAI
jgi:hypothetical protein